MANPFLQYNFAAQIKIPSSRKFYNHLPPSPNVKGYI